MTASEVVQLVENDRRNDGVGQIAAVLWLISFSLGVVVYVMLYVVY